MLRRDEAQQQTQVSPQSHCPIARSRSDRPLPHCPIARPRGGRSNGIPNSEFRIPNSSFLIPHSLRYAASAMPRLRMSALERDLLLRGVWEGLGTPECLVTGGYVRDRLLGRETVDLDLVLPGNLDDARGPARRLAARLDGSAHVLGRDDKTGVADRDPGPQGRIVAPRQARSRKRHPPPRLHGQRSHVAAARRTAHRSRSGGQVDLRAGTLRAVCKKNLQEDPVRLVRAARFLAQFPEFTPEERTAGWIRSLAPRVRRAPPERLGQEFLKLVTLPYPRRGFEAMLDFGILQRTIQPATAFDGPWIAANLDAVSRLRPNAHPLRAALSDAGDFGSSRRPVAGVGVARPGRSRPLCVAPIAPAPRRNRGGHAREPPCRRSMDPPPTGGS